LLPILVPRYKSTLLPLLVVEHILCGILIFPARRERRERKAPLEPKVLLVRKVRLGPKVLLVQVLQQAVQLGKR
jgi:hypothetical protein